jgi:hypothetical protein
MSRNRSKSRITTKGGDPLDIQQFFSTIGDKIGRGFGSNPVFENIVVMKVAVSKSRTEKASRVADGFKIALCLISRGLEGVDARIVHTQHDEIIVEARDGIEDQVYVIVKE